MSCCARLLLLLLGFGLAGPAGAAELSVFAASSLRDALSEVVAAYQRQYPQDRVRLNFAGSQSLALQIEQGAPADLFLSANRRVMKRLQAADLVQEVRPLLGNRLVVAARKGLQPPLRQLSDLGRPGLLLALGNPQVPIGDYSQQLLKTLAAEPSYGAELVQRIRANLVSEESRVKAIVAKLQLGEVDAGIVYQTDLHGDGLVLLSIPDVLSPPVRYPLAKVAGRTGGDAFYAFLLSELAADIFHRYGFTVVGGQG